MQLGGMKIPPQSKKLEVLTRRKWILGGEQTAEEKERGYELTWYEVVIGVHWSPGTFFNQRVQVKHPAQEDPLLSDDTKRCIFKMLVAGPQRWEQQARKQLKKWSTRRDGLTCQEQQSHEALNFRVKLVVRQKKLLLFKEMLAWCQHEGQKVSLLMATGFPIVGELDESGVFPVRPWQERIPGADPEWLWLSAKLACKNQRDRWKDTPMDDVLREVYKSTCEGEESETRKQWVNGPFTEEEKIERVGPLFLPCRRFGVQQNDKIRPIDDFSEYFLNACVTTHDRVTVSGVDAIASYVRV